MRRPGFDGEPTTGSKKVLGEDSLAEVGVPPNMNPPDSLLLCFFDIDPIRRIVFAVDMAKLAVCGDTADGGGGFSEDEYRFPTIPAGLGAEGP